MPWITGSAAGFSRRGNQLFLCSAPSARHTQCFNHNQPKFWALLGHLAIPAATR